MGHEYARQRKKKGFGGQQGIRYISARYIVCAPDGLLTWRLKGLLGNDDGRAWRPAKVVAHNLCAVPSATCAATALLFFLFHTVAKLFRITELIQFAQQFATHHHQKNHFVMSTTAKTLLAIKYDAEACTLLVMNQVRIGREKWCSCVGHQKCGARQECG